MRSVIEQGLSRVLIGTVADAGVVAGLMARGAGVGDAVDVLVGGLVDESAGLAVRVQGRIVGVSQASRPANSHTWFHIGFGGGNVLMVSPYLAQIMEPSTFTDLGIEPAEFDVFAIKSCMHFRRGFDDSGFARTIQLVEPDRPFLGIVRLGRLPYRHVDMKAFYPHGSPVLPVV